MSDDGPGNARMPAPCPGAWTLPECPLPVAGAVDEALCWNAGEAARWVSCVQTITMGDPVFGADPWTCTDGLTFEFD